MRPVVLVAAHRRGVETQKPVDLLSDRREHLLWRRAAGDKCRDPPQRRLLVGKLTQPGLIGRVTAHLPVGGMARTDGGI